ncbi:hypothetical protein HanIR_Chr02g0060851 [Helianthus annuus]|nr:hypothetical protein HanIR_Chr02g0060851 [Helianthus annuus]
MQHGTFTNFNLSLKSLLNTVRETNSEISGRTLNNVRLNSRTAAGTSAPTANGAYPFTQAS